MNFRPQFLGLLLSLVLAPAVYFLSPELSTSRLIFAIIIVLIGLSLIAASVYKKTRNPGKALGTSLSIGIAIVFVSILLFTGLFILAISAI